MHILIMDDKKTRQEQDLGDGLLSELSSLDGVDLIYGFDYTQGCIASSDYGLLAFDRTFLKDRGWLDAVVDEALASSRYLVLFSDVISENMIFGSGRVVRMTSEDFYSAGTVSFLKSLSSAESQSSTESLSSEGALSASGQDLMFRLLYGRDWKVAIGLRERYLGWLEEADAHTSVSGHDVEEAAVHEASSAAGHETAAGGKARRKVLVLHNGNLPGALLTGGVYGDVELCVAEAFHPESENSVENYDTFVHWRLGKEFMGDSGCGSGDGNGAGNRRQGSSEVAVYDAVVLPFSFSSYNCMEFTGLRTAMHIRLTPSWGHASVPVLFLSPFSLGEVGRMSPYGAFLLTPWVRVTDGTSPGKVCDVLREMIAGKASDENATISGDDAVQEEYCRFLDKVTVEPPAMYDFPHSVSAGWTLMRWKEMLRWSDGKGPEISDDVFQGMLYFKYVLAASGKRSVFRNKYRKSPVIDGISGKKFVLIDPYAEKGWKEMLEAIIVKESGARLRCFGSFEYSGTDGVDTGLLERAELLDEIDRFLAEPEVAGADCYILDLKLCQGDEECQSEEMSGLEVVRRIKALNRASQVVVFTASDQVQNLKDTLEIMGIAGYAVKEDPADNFSRGESARLFVGFCSALQKAARLSYLKRYVSLLDSYAGRLGEDAGLLDDVVDLLLTDRPDLTLKMAVLDFLVFLENYLKDRYIVSDDGFLYRRRDHRMLAEFGDRIFFHSEKKDGYSNVVDVRFYDRDTDSDYGWSKARDSDLRDVLVPLHFQYGISEEDCRRIVLIKLVRNTMIAHGGGDLPMTPDYLVQACDRILFPMLEADMQSL